MERTNQHYLLPSNTPAHTIYLFIDYRCSEEHYSDQVSLSNYNIADDKKLNKYCTSPHLPNYILQDSPIISESDFFRVTFKSGMDGSGTGFRAVYKFIEPGQLFYGMTFVVVFF